MKSYLELCQHVLRDGHERTDRTGVGTLSVFGVQTRYDLRDGFPLLTTKKVLFDAVARELFWFLRGATNIHDGLAEHTPIWNAWADENGELGPIYGAQWRNWGGQPIDASPSRQQGIDQIRRALDTLKRDPYSRRNIVSAWNVGELDKMRLPPCHLLFQFYVIDQRLDCQLYQRSADIALGVPFNIASYALLMTMMAKDCGLIPGIFIHTLGDAHVYLNHVDALREQLSREPKPLPRLRVADKPFDALRFDDVAIEGYQHHPFIKFPIAV
ncbi:MAG: thymidylate synthase [Myxococcales bacterium]|nr:thymidylate synthase [Myxococcales bacterium]